MKLSDGTVFAREWGRGSAATILCWHGAGGSSADYERVGPGLAAVLGAHVVALDAPGHGRSAVRRAEELRPSALAALAAQILDQLEVERATFVGFSWGGSIGCWFASLYPERAQALTLVEGGHLGFADLAGFDTDRTLAELVDEARAAAAREGSSFGSHTPETAGAMIRGLCVEPTTAAYPRLAATELPVLFIGARAEAAAPQPLERLRRLVRQIETVQLPTGSHELLRDAPADVVRETADWLASLRLFPDLRPGRSSLYL